MTILCARERLYNLGYSDLLLDPAKGCPSTHDIHYKRLSWLSLSIIMLSLYSTLMSGMWFVLAIVQPRYGKKITSGGSLTLSTASTLFALFAKTIEITFVTVFVTFIGQVLSRRSLVKTSRGITIAELNMRTWVIQPGSMFTHWENLRHAGYSVLGLIAFTAAIISLLYTTASDALVSPHLKFGGWEPREMQGVVWMEYSNPYYIEDQCSIPVRAFDPSEGSATCLGMEHAGSGIFVPLLNAIIS
jgi:hypothetical protein